MDARKVEDDVSKTLMVVSREVADATKRTATIVGLEFKGALKWLTIRIEIKSRAAISCIRSELDRDDTRALRNVASCRAVLHNWVAEAHRSLSETTDAVADFDENIAVVELEQAREAESN